MFTPKQKLVTLATTLALGDGLSLLSTTASADVISVISSVVSI